MPPAPIYVEILIRGSLDEVWRLTQTPELHRRWDLRFTDVEYLPRPDDAQPQRFLYATRIGFGIRVAGEGETVGQREGPAARVSSLRFRSDDPKSLILEGSGFWKYVPTEDGVRFLTRYDYRTRFGRPGRWIDRLVFRPLLGWATAWSFDALRLWVERGLEPGLVGRAALSHALARVALAAIWIYQGLVPKLLYRDVSGEVDTVRALGWLAGREREAVAAAGVLEVLVGVAMLVGWRARWLFPANAAVLLALATSAALADPALYARQFGPATLTVAMLALAGVGWSASQALPTASACLRREPERAR